jgi:TRAP-type transport system periplasmic protein
MSSSSTTRRRFVQGTAATTAIAPFFIGRPASAADEFIVKVATVAPPDTAWASMVNKFRKWAKDKSGGRVKVKAYLGGALGDEIATAEGTKRGSIQAWGGSIGALASAVPEIECLELPYLFKSAKTADGVLDKIRTNLHDLLWDRGYKLMFYSENGYRSIGALHPVEGVKDLKGRKFRSLQNDVHLDTWRAWGASPVPMAVTEVLSSLQTGVVDGYDNTPVFTFAASWYVATRHFTLTEHIYQPAAVVFSRKFWESMPKELQEALSPDSDEVTKMESRGRRNIRAMEPQLIQNFSDAGIKVHKLSASDKKAFATPAQKAWGQFEKRTTKAGKSLFKAIKANV